MGKTLLRQCISCRKQLAQSELTRITRVYDLINKTETIIVNPNKHQFGRSAYLCKSPSCINLAIKEKKISRMLKLKKAGFKAEEVLVRS